MQRLSNARRGGRPRLSRWVRAWRLVSALVRLLIPEGASLPGIRRKAFVLGTSAVPACHGVEDFWRCLEAAGAFKQGPWYGTASQLLTIVRAASLTSDQQARVPRGSVAMGLLLAAAARQNPEIAAQSRTGCERKWTLRPWSVTQMTDR